MKDIYASNAHPIQGARAEEHRIRAAILAELDISPCEASLYCVVRYGMHMPPDPLAERASRSCYRFDDSVTEAGCRIALEKSLANGRLQIVDESILAEISGMLRNRGILGPIYRFPFAEDVDFTEKGAALWREYGRRIDPRDNVYTECVHEKSTRFFGNRAAAVAEIERYRQDEDYVVSSEPIPIGPWRAQWWRRFPEGYRVEIEMRVRWQGRAANTSEATSFWYPPDLAGRGPTRELLARHGLTPKSWCVLAAAEEGPIRWDGTEPPHEIQESFRWNYAVPIAADDAYDGLTACLQAGFLQVLDASAIKEIHTRLCNDPVFLPLPKQAELREIDDEVEYDPPPPTSQAWSGRAEFTQAGADLYRSISAETWGENWEDRLSVERTYYSEEHHYCASDSILRGRAIGYPRSGMTYRATRIVPIGPWCGYWWDRYSSGVRLELEIELE